MIEINLLPEDLRVKTKTKHPGHETGAKYTGFNQEQLFLYALPAILAVLICLHFYFVVIAISKNSQLAALNHKWVQLAPEKKALDEFNNEYSVSSTDVSAVELLKSKRILWAQKLNKLSLNLPSGVWFNEITINPKEIVIRGGVISLEKEEVSLINKLLDNLKATTEFSKDFVTFELSSVQKKNVGGYDVADFVLSGALKAK